MAVGATAGTRRAVYGFNVVLQAVIAVSILIFAIYIAQRFNKQFDLTRSGINSLSPSSAKLLKSLDQPIKITAMYGTSRKNDTEAETQIGQIRDLLSLYDDVGGSEVTTFLVDPVEESGRVVQILKDLRNKPAYKDEWQPHKAAVDKAKPLVTQIAALTTTELQKLEELAQANAQLESTPGYPQIRNALAQIQRSAQNLDEALREFDDQEVPAYGATSKTINDFAARAAEFLESVQSWMERTSRSIPTASIDLKQWFTNAPQRMLEPVSLLKELQRETAELKEVKLEEIYRQMQGTAPIIVESNDEAIIVPSREIWRYEMPSPDEPGAASTTKFEGEAVVSSAILRLTQKDKTGVIFVRYGGTGLFEMDPAQMQLALQQGMRDLPTPPFAALGKRLKQSNFVYAEWDVKQSPAPPQIEDVVRTVYVVLPPPPPQATRPGMPPTSTGMSPNDVKVVTGAIESAGRAIFLTGWQPPAVSAPGMLASFPFSSYLEEQWGIAVKIDHLVVAFAMNPREDGLYIPTSRDPTVLQSPAAFAMTDHAIAAPIRAIPVGLRLVCPLKPAETADGADAPAELHTLAQVSNELVWGVADPEATFQRDFGSGGKGTKPYPESIRAPFDVITVATKKVGDNEQSVIVIGAQDFLSDSMTGQMQLTVTDQGMLALPSNPGNADLFINALYWLTGNVDRISVGPRTNDVPRLENLDDPKTKTMVDVFLVGIWPAFALLFGGVVWFFRRR